MGITDSNPFAAGVMDSVRGALGLFKDVNKTPTVGDQSIVPMDEYESTLSPEKILELTRDWKKQWETYNAGIEKTQDTAFQYWLGQQKTDAIDNIEGRNLVDNLIFESLETFLPIATRANPDPLVSSDNSPEGMALSKDIKDALVFQADKQKLRMKLKSLTRNWAIMRLGIMEISYDYSTDDIKTTVLNTKRVMLDPKGYVDESASFVGEWAGIRTDFKVSTLVEMFPEHKKEIELKGKMKKGTKLEVIKWWIGGTDIAFTLDELVLAKKKNPHWNYDMMEKRLDPETGVEMEELIQGRNHFPKPMMPLVFLSVFKTGIQPHDDTSLILQNIGTQDQINKRYRQLDKNIDSQNNGMIVDGTKMTQEQAAEAASALRRGASIRVMGNVNEVVKLGAMPQLPGDVWASMRDSREQLKNIFGISGATPGGIQREDTARGKILVNQLDSSRIGGGVTEYIEQAADTAYNWWAQMMYVHYDNEHYINSVGAQQGQEMIMLKNTRFIKNMVITVKEGSLIPKDPMTERNEAVDLWSAQAIDPITLYKKLDYPDPMGAAKQLVLWQMLQKGMIPPQAYIPDFQQPPMASPFQTGGELPVGANPPGTPQAPGVGGQPVNPIGPANQPQPNPIEAQGRQLLQSVPTR